MRHPRVCSTHALVSSLQNPFGIEARGRAEPPARGLAAVQRSRIYRALGRRVKR
jgi:hypothetical protein